MPSFKFTKCCYKALATLLLSNWTVFGVASALKFDGAEYLPLGKLPGDQVFPVVTLNSGNGIVVWQDNTDGSGLAVRGRLLSSQFTGVFPPFYVNSTFADDQENAYCVALPNGDFFLTWQSGARSAQRIIGRVLGSDGVFRTGEIEISVGTGARAPKAVVNRDSSVTVIWTQTGIDADMDAVVARTLSSAGAPQTSPVQLNVVENHNQRDPVAVSLGDGSLFVVWISENPFGAQAATVVGRKLDSSLSPTSGEIGITPGKNPCAAPVLIKLADRIVVAWSEFQLDMPENGWDLLAKPIAFNGAALGSARRITARQQGDQGDLCLAFNGDKIFAAFTSAALDGSGLGIGMQELDAEGNPVDLDLVANTTRRQNQVRPAMSFGPSGSGLVVWVGFGSAESGMDLFAQRIGKTDAALPAPSAPIAVALSSSKIRVACSDAAGLPVAKYLVFMDGSSTPTESVTPYVTVGSLTPESEHRFSVALMMLDGRVTPQSPSQTAVTWSEDENADGLPDSWQAKFFGSNSSFWPPPNADTDGDRNSNRDEFLAGTNPADSTSALRTSLESTPLGTLLVWNSRPGGLYQIQASSDLVGWSDVGGIRLASGERESVLMQDVPANSYFRINCLR